MIAFPWRRSERPPGNPSLARHMLHFIWRHLSSLVLTVLVLAFAIVVLLPHVIVNVPSGDVGVVWKRFGGGTALDPRSLRDEGFGLILPWDRIFFL